MPLDPDSLGILRFEKQPWVSGQAKRDAIAEQFGWTPTRYYQRLTQLVDSPAALAAEPVLINRLRRIRDRRRDRLHGRSSTTTAAIAWTAAAATAGDITLSLPRQRSVQHVVVDGTLTASSTIEEHAPRG